MNIFEKNLRAMLKGVDVDTYLDNLAIIKMDANRRVEVRCVTTGTHRTYTALCVKIIHKENGEITRKQLKFEDHIKSRSRPNEKGLHFDDYNINDWYLSHPTKPEEMSEPINKFIKAYV